MINIGIDHLADIDYKGFIKIYNACTKDLFNFLIVDTTKTINFDETLFNMTVKDWLKILDRQIKQNKADYDLYRQNVEIFALSSGDLNKYEYLTKKDLGYKPDPVQKSKFEYSSLGQMFNK